MFDKQELHEYDSKQDPEKGSGGYSLASTLSAPADAADEKLRAWGAQNPHYDHELTWTAAEEKELVRIFDLKVLSWIGVMCTLERPLYPE